MFNGSAVEIQLKDLYQFWFEDLFTNPLTLQQRAKIWFSADLEVDQVVKIRFASALDSCDPTKMSLMDRSLEVPHNCAKLLSMILLLDQVPRHVFRGTPRAFEFDSQSLLLTKEGLKNGCSSEYNIFEKIFFYMPLQHSEVLEDQELSVEKFSGLSEQSPEPLKFFFDIAKEKALQHHFAIQKFGRFPHRNKILNRKSSEAELEFLKDPQNWF